VERGGGAHWESKVSSTRHRKDSCFATSRASVKERFGLSSRIRWVFGHPFRTSNNSAFAALPCQRAFGFLHSVKSACNMVENRQQIGASRCEAVVLQLQPGGVSWWQFGKSYVVKVGPLGHKPFLRICGCASNYFRQSRTEAQRVSLGEGDGEP